MDNKVSTAICFHRTSLFVFQSLDPADNMTAEILVVDQGYQLEEFY